MRTIPSHLPSEQSPQPRQPLQDGTLPRPVPALRAVARPRPSVPTPTLPALAVLALVGVALGLLAAPAAAGNYPMGNFDLSGSRSIPSALEPFLTRGAVADRGLEVQRLLPTDHPVAAVPVVVNGTVYAGDIDFDTFGGSLYAFDAETGALHWKTATGGLIASPLVAGRHVWVGNIAGTLLRIDRKTGAIEGSFTAGLRPGFDSIWTGPMKIGETILVAINPNDEFPGPFAPGGLGALIALDASTLTELWRFVPVDNDVDEPPVAGELYGGAGIWNTQITYSPRLGLLFFGTGQTTYTTDGRTPGSDSVFAVRVEDGSLAWQTQMVDGDVWRAALPFHYADPAMPPRDTDIGDAPALFWQDGQPRIAVGSKRGIFYVMDARDGTILNGSGRDAHGFRNGLEVLQLPGPGLDGGFNLDSGTVSGPQGDVVHFGIVNDYAGAFDESESYCYIAFYGIGVPECPSHVSFGHLVLIDGDGSRELGRYSNPRAALSTPLHLDGMIVVREVADLVTFDVDKVVVLDVSDPTDPRPIPGATVDLPGTRSLGGHLSIADGRIFAGSGFYSDQFGSPVGVWVIGLEPGAGPGAP